MSLNTACNTSAQAPNGATKLRVAKWETFQHYKDRNPPWIKLHRSLMTSETWVSASNEGRVLAIACMMLAADTGNEIPANSRYIRRVAYLDFDPDFNELLELGFLEWIENTQEIAGSLGDASAVLADARPETETETETDIPLANANGLSAVEITKAIFDTGIAILGEAGTAEKQARSLIGMWRKRYGDPVVLAVFGRCPRNLSNPTEWMTKALQSEAGNGRQTYQAGKRNGIADALDREIGFGEPAGTPERRTIRGGTENGIRAIAGPAAC